MLGLFFNHEHESSLFARNMHEVRTEYVATSQEISLFTENTSRALIQT
jgi:hypothetical protein